MAKVKPFNLFIYGTLMNPAVFRAVTGLTLVRRAAEADNVASFQARRAILNGYKKVSFDNTYQYALPDRQGRIRGYLVGPLPGETMSALREYEGRNYSKRTVRVLTKDGYNQAVVFVANVEALEHAFGYAFKDEFKQEILLGRKIERALLETEREQLHTTEMTARRAIGELRGPTIRDLIRRHFEAGGISDYAIRHALKDRPLRDFSRVINDREAQLLAPNYLSMAVRQVIFNEIEEHVRLDFRYELDHMGLGGEYYERTVSSLASLRMLNNQQSLLDMIVQDCLAELDFRTHRLVDYVRWAVIAADAAYDPRDAEKELSFIRSHTGHGHIPMGAELEFSNIGHGVIRDPDGRHIQDRDYDGFIYFGDFGLDVLTWKLGGHIDDHHEKASARPRRGFFEVAMGNLSIEENISKPLTDDPWQLNQLIHQARRFYRIAPHSVHVSLQLRRQRRRDLNRLLPLSVMKCLFAVAGDPARDEDGRVRVRRLTGDEIITRDPVPHMLFSDVSVRHSAGEAEALPRVRPPQHSGRYVQQFRFLRLSPQLNYEPIAMALKGIELSHRPGNFLTAAQYQSSPRHRRVFERLLAWGAQPTPLSDQDRERFLRAVRRGLMTERRGRPVHSEAYIAWCLAQLRSMLDGFDALVSGRAAEKASPAG
jgi:gamma-glutamylcyclotransferase (GGCT)/AIG2-like uncharacterized protein YtfP